MGFELNTQVRKFPLITRVIFIINKALTLPISRNKIDISMVHINTSMHSEYEYN